MPVLLITFIIFLSLLPGFAWLFLFLREDIHPEPKKFIFYTFGVGVLMSIPIVFLQLLGSSTFSFIEEFILKISFTEGFILTIPIIVIYYAFIEEVFKFFASYISVGERSVLDEPVDFMIYMIVAALGLATIENFFILTEIISVGGYQLLQESIQTISIRFVGATFLHAVASGIVGYYWAKSRLLENKLYIVLGIIFATLLHVVFNVLVFNFQSVDYLLFPSLFLLAASVLLFNDFNKIKQIK